MAPTRQRAIVFPTSPRIPSDACVDRSGAAADAGSSITVLDRARDLPKRPRTVGKRRVPSVVGVHRTDQGCYRQGRRGEAGRATVTIAPAGPLDLVDELAGLADAARNPAAA
jgi:hypothetical protein